MKEKVAIEDQLDPRVIGLSDRQMVDVMQWLAELEIPCSESRAAFLVSELSDTLQSYMGIDRELLRVAFWSDYRLHRLPPGIPSPLPRTSR